MTLCSDGVNVELSTDSSKRICCIFFTQETCTRVDKTSGDVLSRSNVPVDGRVYHHGLCNAGLKHYRWPFSLWSREAEVGVQDVQVHGLQTRFLSTPVERPE